jgi:hypothetical protein
VQRSASATGIASKRCFRTGGLGSCLSFIGAASQSFFLPRVFVVCVRSVRLALAAKAAADACWSVCPFAQTQLFVTTH